MSDIGHLSGDELVDLVEGLVSDADSPHVTSCDRCRGRLADLRAARAMVSEVEVPEPSPLFWKHFSARVREAVAQEPTPADGWWHRLWSWPGAIAPVSAIAVLVLLFAVTFRAPSRTRPDAPAHVVPAAATTAAAPASVSLELLSDALIADDQSLALVADLTESLGWDAAADAGFVSDGSAEHAVTHMSAADLQQLERLLTEEMSRKGA